MSDNDTETEAEQFESKSAFMDAVQDEGAVLGGVEYFREGEGNGATYKACNDEGEVESVTKSEIESLWDELHDEDAGEDEEQEDDEPEEQHLGTFYFSQANWDEDADRETLEEMLDDAGWYIDGQVDSGGYRIKTER